MSNEIYWQYHFIKEQLENEITDKVHDKVLNLLSKYYNKNKGVSDHSVEIM